MNNIYIIILLLVIIVVIFLLNKNEHLDSNIDNLNASGHIKSTVSSPEGGNIFLVNPSKTGAGSTSSWAINNMKAPHAQGLNFLRYNADGTGAGPSVIFNDNGNVNMSNDLTVDRVLNIGGGINTGGYIKSTVSSPEGGNIFLVNPSKTGAGSTSSWAINNMKAPHAQGLNFLRYNADGTGAGPSVIFNDNGNVNMKNDLTVDGVINAKNIILKEGSLPLSREAIQNIASIYNKDNLSVTNLTAANNLNVGGNMWTTNLSATKNIDAIDTISTGKKLIAGNELCIGDFCINKCQLKSLFGGPKCT
jgi:hypothetical protein